MPEILSRTHTNLVMGLGQTGWSVARYCAQKSYPFAIWDTRECPPDLPRFMQEFPDIPVYTGLDPLPIDPEGWGRVVWSQGLDPAICPFWRLWQSRGQCCTDIDLFVSEAGGTPIWGITGSNGKSTVTALLGEIVRASGCTVGVGGNLGPPALDLLDKRRKLYILELSSFLLELSRPIPLQVGVFLNLSPDHLDRHANWEAYRAAKAKIFQMARIAVCNADDPATHVPVGASFPGQQLWTFGSSIESSSTVGPNRDAAHHVAWVHIAPRQGKWMHADTCLGQSGLVKLQGRHQYLNIAAAWAVLCATRAVPWEIAEDTIAQFPGLPHRCQWVGEWAGVRWINDSKGTNLGAAIAAIESLGESGETDSRIVWLGGGDGKGADFSLLAPVITRYARAAIVFGRDKHLLASALRECIPLQVCDSLQEAVQLAQAVAQPGDTVLLSPACASWDQFRHYAHRGDCFMEYVRALLQ